MTIEINEPEAIEELEALAKELELEPSIVIERLLVEQGLWVPKETLGRWWTPKEDRFPRNIRDEPTVVSRSGD